MIMIHKNEDEASFFYTPFLPLAHFVHRKSDKYGNWASLDDNPYHAWKNAFEHNLG